MKALCLLTAFPLAFACQPARAQTLSPPSGKTWETPAAGNSADAAWQALAALDAGPRGNFRGRDEALALARDHLDRQENALRRFLAGYPADARRFEAQTRLADILTAKARLPGRAATEPAALRAAAARLLENVESNPAAPPAARAGAAYARVRQLMQDAGASAQPETRRDALTRAIRAFDAAHPADRRVPALLVELATLYDARPSEKKALLDEAVSRIASTPGVDETVRARAADDLRRLALLGRPLSARLPPALDAPNPSAGGELSARRGRVVVLFFWASWSPPALRELERLQSLAMRFDPRQVEFLTVSLDEDRAALAAAVRATHLAWPVFCDGRGWEGELPRTLGLNALPTTWVLDRAGVLLTLNARERTEELIRQALR